MKFPHVGQSPLFFKYDCSLMKKKGVKNDTAALISNKPVLKHDSPDPYQTMTYQITHSH
jgi:hypothetical protein